MTELNTYALIFAKIERERINQKLSKNGLYRKAGLINSQKHEKIKEGKGEFATVVKLCRALGIISLEL